MTGNIDSALLPISWIREHGRIFFVCILLFSWPARTVPAQSCHASIIEHPVPFMANHGEVFTLSGGGSWVVTDRSLYLYEYRPQVTICPDRGVLFVGSLAISIRRQVPIDLPGAKKLPGKPEPEKMSPGKGTGK